MHVADIVLYLIYKNVEVMLRLPQIPKSTLVSTLDKSQGVIQSQISNLILKWTFFTCFKRLERGSGKKISKMKKADVKQNNRLL